MSDNSEFMDTIKRAVTDQRTAVEATAERALAMIKAGDVVSFIPEPAMPLTGLLLYVHPDVYARVRTRLQELERDADE